MVGEDGLWVRVTKPLPAAQGFGRCGFAQAGVSSFGDGYVKRIKHDRRSLLKTIRASLPLPIDEII